MGNGAGSGAKVMEFVKYFKNKGEDSPHVRSKQRTGAKENLKNLNWLRDRPCTRGETRGGSGVEFAEQPHSTDNRPVTRNNARRPISRQSIESHRPQYAAPKAGGAQAERWGVEDRKHSLRDSCNPRIVEEMSTQDESEKVYQVGSAVNRSIEGAGHYIEDASSGIRLYNQKGLPQCGKLMQKISKPNIDERS